MRTVAKNPFLPKPSQGVRWIKGPFSKDRAETRRSPAKSASPKLRPVAGDTAAGRLFHIDIGSHGWDGNLDMFAIMHGAAGCGALRQMQRLNMPGFWQGVESFTSIDACTNLVFDDLRDAGDAKLTQALDEALALFPLATGVVIQKEGSLGLLESNSSAIAKAEGAKTGKLIVATAFGSGSNSYTAEASTLKSAARHHKHVPSTPYDVALTICNEAPALVWIVAKLLREIGLNPILMFGSTVTDMAQMTGCKLVIGGVRAQLLHDGTGIPAVEPGFANPNATDEMLRRIAGHFDNEIQNLAESVIAENRKKVDAVIAYYRPRFEKKLFFNLEGYPESALESFRMLGFRVGDWRGWPGLRGVPHICRSGAKAYDYTKVHEAVIADAKPDVVFDSHDRNHIHWHKRGLTALPFSPLLDRLGHGYWGYDGFALLAAALDRYINAPWRKLVKPPWPTESG